MADIVAEVEQEALDAAARPIERQSLKIDGHLYFFVDGDPLTPKETRDLAATSHLVIYDSCGCGTYCNAYEVLSQREVDALVDSGVPTFEQPAVAIEDEDGNDGVLISGPLRWGSLR